MGHAEAPVGIFRTNEIHFPNDGTDLKAKHDEDTFGAGDTVFFAPGSYSALDSTKDLDLYANTGEAGGGSWEPSVQINSTGEILMDNTSQGSAGSRKVKIGFTDGVEINKGNLKVDQDATGGARPVIILDQADVSEEMIEFVSTIGTGNAIEAVGGKSLSTTHFLKVTLPGALTRYIPCGTIA